MQKGKKHIENALKTNPWFDGLVSVIMPMHNSARYLREAIESVYKQTYTNWELLIVDDGSCDDSLAIAREYEEKDERVHVLINESPIGIPSAPRNIGIEAAKGRYIAFLDSDDVYLPNKFEMQIPFFKDDQVSVVYANYEKMTEEGTRSNRIIKAPLTTTYKSLLKGNVITMPAGMYDRSKVGTVYMKDKRHEDYVMWLEILKQGLVAKSTGTVVAVVRVRNASVSSNKLKTIGWQWRVYREVEGLSILSSAYYFVFYAFKAFVKSLV